MTVGKPCDRRRRHASSFEVLLAAPHPSRVGRRRRSPSASNLPYPSPGYLERIGESFERSGVFLNSRNEKCVGQLAEALFGACGSNLRRSRDFSDTKRKPPPEEPSSHGKSGTSVFRQDFSMRRRAASPTNAPPSNASVEPPSGTEGGTGPPGIGTALGFP